MKDLIIGGTGTLGEALLSKLSSNNEGWDIAVFSRDELKQQQLKKKYSHVTMILGDIRDKGALQRAMVGVTRVFHFSALKHVDILESNIEEAVATNILGLFNSAEAAIENKVPYFYFTSTDKAVLPINVYGMTKGIAERYLLDKNKKQDVTRFKVFRWGNIIGSRGSVIPQFARTIREDGKIFITHHEMTRFWLKIEDAVDFMLHHHENINEVLIPEMKGANILDVARAVKEIVLDNDSPCSVEEIGIRPGEKLHENITQDLTSWTSDSYNHEEIIEMVRSCI